MQPANGLGEKLGEMRRRYGEGDLLTDLEWQQMIKWGWGKSTPRYTRARTRPTEKMGREEHSARPRTRSRSESENELSGVAAACSQAVQRVMRSRG